MLDTLRRRMLARNKAANRSAFVIEGACPNVQNGKVVQPSLACDSHRAEIGPGQIIERAVDESKEDFLARVVGMLPVSGYPGFVLLIPDETAPATQ